MRKFAALIRRVFLSVFMIVFMVACITKAESNTSLGAILYMGMLISCGIYLLFSIISIIARLIHRKGMEESDAMKESFLGVLDFGANGNIINYFRRIAFWGTILFFTNIWLLHVPDSLIVGGPYSNDGYLRGYYGFLLWSVVSLVILFVITLFFFGVYLPHYGTGAYNIFQYIGKIVIADLTTPIRVVKDYFTIEKGKRTVVQIVRFITLVVFVVVNIVAIIKTI